MQNADLLSLVTYALHYCSDRGSGHPVIISRA